MLEAGRLRHRITIQARQESQDAVTGETVVAWANAWADVAAAIEPLSARELIASQAQRSQVSARIIMRPLAGLTARHRIVHNGTVYSIEGVIPDPDSGREWITLPVSEGVANGE
jgi:SPP1 family predicted phage head-tail adaptor